MTTEKKAPAAKNTIYISHGDKGGSGKSFVASATVDCILESTDKIVIVVEGDNTQPDVAPRFENEDRVLGVIAPLNDPANGIGAISNALDKAIEAAPGVDIDIVINTPAGFSETFDESVQDYFIELASMLNYQIKVIYSVGNTAIAKSGAIDFAESKISKKSKVYLAFPEFLEPADTWMKDKSVESIVKSGYGVFIPEVKDMPRELFKSEPNHSLRSLMVMPGLTPVRKMQMKYAFNSVNEQISKVVSG